MIRPLIVTLACVLCAARPASAQDPYNLASPVNNLATIFTDLFGPRGLIVDSLATLPGEQPHIAHFTSDFQFNFSQFSTALVSQLVNVPLPSPGGGFTYQFDSTLGVFQRTTQSFGPILAERADTIGAGRVACGFAFQRVKFDSVEGIDLSKVPAVFEHENAELLGGRQDVVTTINSIEAIVSQSTTFVTLGITDSFDISLAVPVVSNSLTIVSDAHIQRLGTTDELTHFFRQANGEVGDQRVFTASGDATGLGDIMVRAKHTLRKRTATEFAVGLDVRLPTGDEMNLLGSGAPAVQPFAIWSGTFQKVAPHINLGYRWNGSSVLAGNPSTGESRHFPDQFSYALGADLIVNSRLTLAFDVLGRYVIDAERLRAETFLARDGVSTFPNIVFERDSFNALSGAMGFKANLLDRLLLDVNLLFKLDEHGLRDKVTPLIGFEYSF